MLQNNEFWLGFLEMATLSIRIGISEAKHCHPEDENSYLTSSCNPRKHWILATLWDPLIPDPAFDRHFASYWMDQLQSESSIQKNGEKSNKHCDFTENSQSFRICQFFSWKCYCLVFPKHCSLTEKSYFYRVNKVTRILKSMWLGTRKRNQNFYRKLLM